MTTPQTDAPSLQDRLRGDKIHWLTEVDVKLEAAEALDAHEATIAALVEAGDALARQAFCTMTGGHGHLIDDMCAALAKAAALK